MITCLNIKHFLICSKRKGSERNTQKREPSSIYCNTIEGDRGVTKNIEIEFFNGNNVAIH